ncbi:hypothetical protein BDR06DRAFT_975592 [Suillus hirtellus]|nr:hypothetical protein BDR06DRAFT_975592 [Suillus hirtellus]
MALELPPHHQCTTFEWSMAKPTAPANIVKWVNEHIHPQSNLTDSTLLNTSLPQNICTIKNQVDLAGLQVRENLEEEAEEDEVPVLRYSRGMLHLELCDGFTTIKAVEYCAIPQLELGVALLGYKILLKDVQIHRGIIFLEPETIELKAHQTEDHEVMQDEIFLHHLRQRLGQPDPEPNLQPPCEAEAPPWAPSLSRVPSHPVANRQPQTNTIASHHQVPTVHPRIGPTLVQRQPTNSKRCTAPDPACVPSTLWEDVMDMD